MCMCAICLTHMAAAAPEVTPAQGLRKNVFLVPISGNIGGGKTTFINILTIMIGELRKLDDQMGADSPLRALVNPGTTISTALEPIGEFRGSLDLFYEDTSRYAFLLQLDAAFSRLVDYVEKHEAHGTHECCADERAGLHIVISERGPRDDSDVFAKLAIENKLMLQREGIVYQKLIHFAERTLPNYKPRAGVYIRTFPSVCMKRIKGRNRGCEKDMDPNYIEDLHGLHENMVRKMRKDNIPVLCVDSNPEDAAFVSMTSDASFPASTTKKITDAVHRLAIQGTRAASDTGNIVLALDILEFIAGVVRKTHPEDV